MSIFQIFRKDYLHIKSVKIFNKGVDLFNKGNYSAALIKFSDSLRVLKKASIDQSLKNDLNASILVIMSQTKAKINQYELAEQDLDTAISFRPNDEGLYLSLGSLKLDQNKFEQAIDYYDKAIELNSSKPNGYFFRGVCMLELKRYNEAIPNFEKALTIEIYLNDNVAQSGTLACLGRTYAGLNDFSKAIEYYDEAIFIDDKNSSAFVNRGNCKIDLGEQKEGCEDYYRALELGEVKVQGNIDEYCKKQ